MSGYIGADADRLDALGHSLMSNAAGLDDLRSSLGAQLFETDWFGADADLARTEWDGSHAPALWSAAEILRNMSEALFVNAGQQRNASTADGSPSLAAVPRGQIPAGGTRPADVKAWWAGLSQQQRDYLMTHDAQRIGSLDGIPARDRDAANRLYLDQLRAHEPHDKGLDSLHQRLSQQNGPHAYLMGLSDKGDGRAIVAINNPDEASNVLTFVPGTGASLSGVGGDLTRADRMAASANQFDPSRPTSVVLWLGYDAPDTVPDAIDPHYAQDAADDLSQFQHGLRATHSGEPSHNTVLGHSYGSTTVGYSAREQSLAADDMIFVGSPGVGVEHAGDLHLDPGHVWSSTAANDPIQYAARLDPGLIGNEIRGDLIHGANPSRSDFGAHVFTSDPGNPLVVTTHVSVDTPGFHVPGTPWDVPSVHVGGFDVPTGVDMSAHSQYWDEHSKSLSNITRIATGHYGDVR